MKTVEQKKIEQLSFYQKLVAETIDPVRYPWYRMVIEKELDEEEVHEVYALCEELDKHWEKGKEAGMVDPTPLLLQYVGLLPHRLEPFMTARALQKQGLFVALTEELIRLMKEVEDQG